MRRVLAFLLVVAALSCAGSRRFEPEILAAAVPESPQLARLALDFYGRIANRRFNSIATFRDPALQEFFRTPAAFADYYAELADKLSEAHFEANRPTRIDLEQLVFEEPAKARFTVRYHGENGRPLRWWGTNLLREEVWVRERDRWWIVPGKL